MQIRNQVKQQKHTAYINTSEIYKKLGGGVLLTIF